MSEVLLGGGIALASGIVGSLTTYIVTRRQSKRERYFDIKYPLYRDFLDGLDRMATLLEVQSQSIELMRNNEIGGPQEYMQQVVMFGGVGADGDHFANVMTQVGKLEKRFKNEERKWLEVNSFLRAELGKTIIREIAREYGRIRHASTGLRVLSAKAIDSLEHKSFQDALAPVLEHQVGNVKAIFEPEHAAPAIDQNASDRVQAALEKLRERVRIEVRKEL